MVSKFDEHGNKRVKGRKTVFTDYQQAIPTPKYSGGLLIALQDNGSHLVVAPVFSPQVVEQFEGQRCLGLRVPLGQRVPEVIDYSGKDILNLDPAKTFSVNGSERSLAELVEGVHDGSNDLKQEYSLGAIVKRNILPALAISGTVGLSLAGGVFLYPPLLATCGMAAFGVRYYLNNLPKAKKFRQKLRQMRADYNDLTEKVHRIVLEEGKLQGIITPNYGVLGWSRNMK